MSDKLPMVKILQRVKDSVSGDIVEYVVEDEEGIIYTVDRSVLECNYDAVIGAELVVGVGFRARSGHNIDTVIKRSENPKGRQNLSIGSSGEFICKDYYGSEFINVCRRIRRYAREGRIVVNTSVHRSNSGLNVQLFPLIKSCWGNVVEFITQYLMYIQPYSLSKFSNKVVPLNNIWVCDIGYTVQLLIKINEADKNSPVVVSFHESNISMRMFPGGKGFRDKPCAVICDDTVGSFIYVYVMRGFMLREIQCRPVELKKDVALIEYAFIEKEFINSLTEEMSGISMLYMGEKLGRLVKPLSVYSIASYGVHPINNLCMLIETFSKTSDMQERSMMSTCSMYILNEMSDFAREKAFEALSAKYGSKYNNKLYNMIISALEVRNES